VKYEIYRDGDLLATFRSRAIRDAWFWALPLLSSGYAYTRGTVKEGMVL
jgi:hypothetical protein